jgi:hypothetical protein
MSNMPGVEPPQPPASTCEACGESFSCGAASPTGCWCQEVTVAAEARDELRQQYSKCLCRPCLERAADSAAAPGA